MVHLTDTSAHGDFILLVQLRTLRILGRATAESNYKPTSTAITVLQTYPERLRLTSN